MYNFELINGEYMYLKLIHVKKISLPTMWTMHGPISNIQIQSFRLLILNALIINNMIINSAELLFILILVGIGDTSWWWNQSHWPLVCHNELTSYGPAPWAFSTPQSRGNTHPAVGQDCECRGRGLYCRDLHFSPGHH